MNHRKLKVTLEIDLEGDPALAFHKAFDRAQEMGTSGRSKRRFAAWLLERSAEAYAVAPKWDLGSWWCFELRPRDVEERKAGHFLEEMEKTQTALDHATDK